MNMTAQAGSGAMFDRIAPRYDLLNRLMSLGMDNAWRSRLLDAAGEPKSLLDLATGTGDVVIAAARRWPGAAVMGLDPSKEMMALGAAKLEKAGLAARIALVEGDAQCLPFEDGRFDAITMAFGIRNVPDRPRALREMFRVLAPGGRVATLELGEPADGAFAGAARTFIHSVVPALGRILSSAEEYRYLARSIAAFPPAKEFAAMVQRRRRAEPFGSPSSAGFGAMPSILEAALARLHDLNELHLCLQACLCCRFSPPFTP
jgi:demethylmenaquinone methyltransferase/2-methoxy-6-polyprenyl-1,4-benzoquinol methylase